MAATYATLARITKQSGDQATALALYHNAVACRWTPADIDDGFRNRVLPQLLQCMAGIVDTLPAEDRQRIARCCMEALASRTNLPDRDSLLAAFQSHLPSDDQQRPQTA